MNFSDSEIIASILVDNSYKIISEFSEADIILLNTCSIRDHAEQRVFNRVKEFNSLKKKRPGLLIGILGCMAERLKDELIERTQYVDIIIGPDAYRDLPKLLATAEAGQKGINVLLSADETYADINPVRVNSNGVTAFISIMRGCENYCSYCVVPYTRGKERSREAETIIREARELYIEGYREITLLGQNVNSYYGEYKGRNIDFADIITLVADIASDMRIRFATSHPKDISDKLIGVIASYENICSCIHLPMQSGSDRILKLMNRKYSSAYYLDRVRKIRSDIKDCTITTDIITGFCTETDEDHEATIKMMKEAEFEYAYMFKYSERPGTRAANDFHDDIPDDIKSNRLKEIIDLQQKLSLKSNRNEIGKIFTILAEGYSKRSKNQLFGRTVYNKVVVFPAGNIKPGDYTLVRVDDCTAATLIGQIVE